MKPPGEAGPRVGAFVCTTASVAPTFTTPESHQHPARNVSARIEIAIDDFPRMLFKPLPRRPGRARRQRSRRRSARKPSRGSTRSRRRGAALVVFHVRAARVRRTEARAIRLRTSFGSAWNCRHQTAILRNESRDPRTELAITIAIQVVEETSHATPDRCALALEERADVLEAGQVRIRIVGSRGP